MEIIKKIICLIIVSTFFLSFSSLTFAETNLPSSQNQLIETHNHNDTSEENIEPESASVGKTIVGLSMWASHRNYHTSYTRTVVRQGKKYVVRYKAAPRSKCWYCKIKSY